MGWECSADDDGVCEQNSPVPSYAIQVYGIVAFVTLFILSIYAAKTNERISFAYFKKNPRKCFSIWIKATYKKRSCYIPAITHLFDQVSDVGVIFTFYYVSIRESECNKIDIDYCNGVNTLYLFIGSLFFFWLYRIMSGLIIYLDTKGPNNINSFQSILMFIIQLFDGLLYKSIYVNYVFDSQVQSNPQRLIQSLEAMFEACPQLLIQLFFLVKIGIGKSDTSTNIIIIFSIIWSLISVVSKSISEDKAFILKNEGQEPLLKWKFPKFISWKWLLRAMFRLFDVSSRMCILLLIWVLLGGFSVIIVICIEFSVLIFISQKTKEFRFVFSIVHNSFQKIVKKMCLVQGYCFWIA